MNPPGDKINEANSNTDVHPHKYNLFGCDHSNSTGTASDTVLPASQVSHVSIVSVEKRYARFLAHKVCLEPLAPVTQATSKTTDHVRTKSW